MTEIQTPSRYARVHAIVWKVTSVAWAGLIFYLSSQGFGSNFTLALMHELVRILHFNLSAVSFEILHHLVRKLAHLTEYAIFAMLLYGSVADDNPFRWRPPRALACLLIPALYSLTDEFHQVFSSGRGPSLIDCGIDTIGASIGILLSYFIGRLHRCAPGPVPLEVTVDLRA